KKFWRMRPRFRFGCTVAERGSRRRRDFPADGLGILVWPQPQKDRLPHVAVATPVGEGHLADDLGPNPADRPVGLRPPPAGTGSFDQGFQLGAQIRQAPLREARPNVADVNQLRAIVDSQDESADALPAPLGFREAADNGLLAKERLDL